MQTTGKNIGKTLVKLREERNLTARELASITKKSPSYISKLETGNVKTPRKETLTIILESLKLEPSEIQEILSNFYGKKGKEIKKVDNILFIKNNLPQEKNSESNVDFIQNPVLPKSHETIQKSFVKKSENEEIIFHFVSRHDLSLELSTIAHQLYETAKILTNRSMLDVRYDSIKNAVNQASDRLDIFKVTYDLYVEKLIRDGHKVNS